MPNRTISVKRKLAINAKVAKAIRGVTTNVDEFAYAEDQFVKQYEMLRQEIAQAERRDRDREREEPLDEEDEDAPERARLRLVSTSLVATPV
jgi:uncharacterized membrane protein